MIYSNEIITSRNNPRVKWAASLSEKKHRGNYGAFIAEGEKLMIEAIGASLPITHFFVLDSESDRIRTVIEKSDNASLYEKSEFIIVTESVFDKISTEKSPNGVITVIKYLDFFRNIDIIYKEEFFLEKSERALALCSLRDPGNLGAVIRSAVAFGVDHIVLSSDCADIYNHKTVRAAMGSMFRIKVSIIKDFSSFIKIAKDCGRNVYAAELNPNAASLRSLNLSSTDIFIIGNEGHGIPSDVSMECTGSVYIPISSKTESLNASVAAAVFMWELSDLN